MIDCLPEKENVKPASQETDQPLPTEAYLSPADFEIFAREYATRLQAVALRILHSPEDAADAVQDSFLAAFARRQSFRGRSTVYTWFYRIVTNTCLMKIRTQRLRTNGSNEDVGSLGETMPQFTHRTISTVGDITEREELCKMIRSKINQLPSDFRTVLLLRNIEELNTHETAQRLQLSLEAVKTRVFRARQALRSLLVESSLQPHS